ncbi:MAG: endolytic transglycosylase MltG [Clostridia bacterium]|nr:endolytic transglycosylase MltG [Clostridia bacterium]
MKDENGRDISAYDFDKLLEEYANITNNDRRDEKNKPEEKKKFVVNIDESLIDVPEEPEKSSSGGIYFSNYNRNKASSKPKPNYSEVNSDIRPAKANKTDEHSSHKSVNKDNIEKKIESIGGRTAAGFLAFILISTILLSYIGISCINDMLAINRSEDMVYVSIPEKADYSEIIDILDENGLIKQKLFCKLFVKFRNLDDKQYLSGVYYLNSKMGVEGMLKDIMAAPVTADTVTLSFPEGWTIQQIFEKLEKFEVADSAKLYTAIRTADFGYDFTGNIETSSDRYLSLEGYLFPDTYDFYVDADTNYVIRKFLSNFEEKWTDTYQKRADQLGYSMDEIVTIASIIQKEAANSEQMKTISSVIHNRLKDPANYPTLGCDSTAIYISNYVAPVIGEAQGKAYYDKYDTSAIKGLPPGPICNPGLDAIEAALYPADTNYYFFAHDNAGKIYVASTYKEHKNNLVRIIKSNNSNNSN